LREGEGKGKGGGKVGPLKLKLGPTRTIFLAPALQVLDIPYQTCDYVAAPPKLILKIA